MDEEKIISVQDYFDGKRKEKKEEKYKWILAGMIGLILGIAIAISI